MEANDKKLTLNNINPEVLQACILEIMESADEILELYQIDGALINLSVGIPTDELGRNDNYSIQPNYDSENIEDKVPFGLQISYDKVFNEIESKQAS